MSGDFLNSLGDWVGSLFGDDGSSDVNGSDLSSDLGETQSSDQSALGGSAGADAMTMDPGAYMGPGSTGAGASGENPTMPNGVSTGNGQFDVAPSTAGSTVTPPSVRAGNRAASANSGDSWLKRLMAGDTGANRDARMGMTALGLLQAILSRPQAPNAAAMRASLQGPYNSFTPGQQSTFDNYMNMAPHTYTPPTGGYVGHKRGGSIRGGALAHFCGGGPVRNYAMGGPVYPSTVGPGSLGPGTGAAHNIMGNAPSVAMAPRMMGGPGMVSPGGRPNGVMGILPPVGGPSSIGPMSPGSPVQPFSPLAMLRNKMQKGDFSTSNFADNHPNFATNHPWLFSSSSPNAGPPLPATQGPQSYATGGFVPGDDPGQADNIPIRVSPGEYVMDADTVSSLGDGNNAAGAKVLDRMRHHIRTVKRNAPTDDIPPAMSGGALSFFRRR